MVAVTGAVDGLLTLTAVGCGALCVCSLLVAVSGCLGSTDESSSSSATERCVTVLEPVFALLLLEVVVVVVVLFPAVLVEMDLNPEEEEAPAR